MRHSTYLTLEPIKPSVSYWEQPSASPASRHAARIDDLKAANKSNNKFLKSAAMRALNNLKKIGE